MYNNNNLWFAIIIKVRVMLMLNKASELVTWRLKMDCQIQNDPSFELFDKEVIDLINRIPIQILGGNEFSVKSN